MIRPCESAACAAAAAAAAAAAVAPTSFVFGSTGRPAGAGGTVCAPAWPRQS